MKYLAPVKLSIIALLLSETAFAFGGSDTIRIEVRANVTSICQLGNVDALETDAGSQLRIVTSCNSDRFFVNLNGVNNLDIIDASSSGRASGIVTPLSNGVQVQPRLPGGQIITINLGNDVSEISSLSVSVSTI